MTRWIKFELYAPIVLLSLTANVGLPQDGFILQPKMKQNVGQKPPATSQPPKPSETPPAQQARATQPTQSQPTFIPPGSSVQAQTEQLRDELQWLKRDEEVPKGHYGRAPEPARANAAVPARPVVYPTPTPTQNAQRPLSAFPSEVNAGASAQPAPAMPTMQGPVNHSTPNALEVANAARQEEEKERQHLAEMISARISATKTTQPTTTVKPLAAPPGWQSVRTRLQGHLDLCERLLQRNAFFSARQEAEQAMLYLTQILDGLQNEYSCTPAWARAQQAMREAEDFKNMQQLTSESTLMQRIIESHQTPVLKAAILDRLAPLVAAQHYREFAVLQLMEATKGHSWASEVFYSLGRAYQAEADNLSSAETLGKAELARWRAVVFYRAAVLSRPSNALAANQLGFILLQMDQPNLADKYLSQSLKTVETPAALSNMVEASRRLGNQEQMQEAAIRLASYKGHVSQVPKKNHIILVDEDSFKRWSPHAASPNAKQ